MVRPFQLTHWWIAPPPGYATDESKALILRVQPEAVLTPYLIPPDVLDVFLTLTTPEKSLAFIHRFGFIFRKNHKQESVEGILRLAYLLRSAIAAAEDSRAEANDTELARSLDDTCFELNAHYPPVHESVVERATYVCRPSSLASELTVQAHLLILNQVRCHECGAAFSLNKRGPKFQFCKTHRTRNARRARKGR